MVNTMYSPGWQTVCSETRDTTSQQSTWWIVSSTWNVLIIQLSFTKTTKSCVRSRTKFWMLILGSFFIYQVKTNWGFQETTSSYRDLNFSCHCSSREIRATAEASTKTWTQSGTKSQARPCKAKRTPSRTRVYPQTARQVSDWRKFGALSMPGYGNARTWFPVVQGW